MPMNCSLYPDNWIQFSFDSCERAAAASVEANVERILVENVELPIVNFDSAFFTINSVTTHR